VEAVKRGDWRAGAFLFERIYGKPRENVAVEMPESTEAVERLSSAELEQLRKQILAKHPHLRLLDRAPSVPPDEETA
jgi:hypothetical protein